MSDKSRKPDLTVHDVAAELSVTREHVIMLINTGQLKGYRVSTAARSKFRVTPEALDEFKRLCSATS